MYVEEFEVSREAVAEAEPCVSFEEYPRSEVYNYINKLKLANVRQMLLEILSLEVKRLANLKP